MPEIIYKKGIKANHLQTDYHFKINNKQYKVSFYHSNENYRYRITVFYYVKSSFEQVEPSGYIQIDSTFTTERPTPKRAISHIEHLLDRIY